MERMKRTITELESRGFSEISIEFLKLLVDDLEQYPELSENDVIDDFYYGIDRLTD